VLEQKPVLTGS